MTNQTAVKRIIETIMKGIRTNTFKVGEPLPPQREMSRLFGVSIVVIREAVKVLEGRGILMGKHGSGVYVISSTPSLPQECLSGVDDAYSLAEIMQFARSIWSAAVQGVIANASDEEILELVKRNQMMIGCANLKQSTHRKLVYESSFGMTICQMSGNRLFYEFMSELLQSTMDIDAAIINDPSYNSILHIDKKILESLLQRDTTMAQIWSGERNNEIDKLIKNYSQMYNRKYYFQFHLFADAP